MFEKIRAKLNANTQQTEGSEKKAAAFTSARLTTWRSRQTELRESFIETLDVIERVGWQTWSIASPDRDEQDFCYTVGVNDIFGLPELISIGLDPKVGANALNCAVRMMREGRNLTEGRIPDVLGGDIEVEFHSIDPKWLHRVMLRTNWYYEGANVPALQLIFPDLENRFQWHMQFDERFKQPMLLPGYPEQDLEREFWDSHDFNFDKKAWKFSDPPSTRVMTTEEAESGAEPITYVAHYAEDGAWIFLTPSMTKGRTATSRLRRMVAVDKSIEQLADLPPGWIAVRDSPEKPWERLIDDEDEEE